MDNLNNHSEEGRIDSLEILVPVYNEETCFSEFIYRTILAFKDVPYVWKVIFINDGSTDSSLEIIKKKCQVHKNFQYISLSRNFGKEAALSAGLHYSCADAVAIIDADLQDPPELIPDMIKMLEEKNADTVFAKRRNRVGESWLKKTTAALFYKVFDHLSRFNFPRDTGDFRIIRKRVVSVLQIMNEKNRFMKGLFAWVGFHQVEFIYDRDARYQGESKFNFWKLWSFAIDGITAFTTIPLKLATYTGLLFSLLAIGYGFYFIVKTLIWGDSVKGFPTLIVVLSFLSGVQLMFLGIIGEYVARVHDEVKNRPLYVIDEANCSRGDSMK